MSRRHRPRVALALGRRLGVDKFVFYPARECENELETTPTPSGGNETQIAALHNRTQRLQMDLGDGPLESHEQGLSNGPSPRTIRGH